MSDLEITIRLPEDLVRRARLAGIEIEDESEAIVDAVEREIQRREAANELIDLAEKLRSLPDDEKPTPEELDAAIRQARTEIAAERGVHHS